MSFSRDRGVGVAYRGPSRSHPSPSRGERRQDRLANRPRAAAGEDGSRSRSDHCRDRGDDPTGLARRSRRARSPASGCGVEAWPGAGRDRRSSAACCPRGSHALAGRGSDRDRRARSGGRMRRRGIRSRRGPRGQRRAADRASVGRVRHALQLRVRRRRSGRGDVSAGLGSSTDRAARSRRGCNSRSLVHAFPVPAAGPPHEADHPPPICRLSDAARADPA